MLMFLDKHNNYFTLMMLIICVPVKLRYRVDCDMSVIGVNRVNLGKKKHNWELSLIYAIM